MVHSLSVETTAVTNCLIKSEESSGIHLIRVAALSERLLIVWLAAMCS